MELRHIEGEKMSELWSEQESEADGIRETLDLGRWLF